jgi:hypothetical protein
MMAAAFLILLGIYAACGFLFAVPFAGFGVQKIDRLAAPGGWGFRLLIIPGAAACWPLLLRRWMKGAQEPPEAHHAHRRAGQSHHTP